MKAKKINEILNSYRINEHRYGQVMPNIVLHILNNKYDYDYYNYLGSGVTSNVYDIGNDKVIKIAKQFDDDIMIDAENELLKLHRNIRVKIYESTSINLPEGKVYYVIKEKVDSGKSYLDRFNNFNDELIDILELDSANIYNTFGLNFEMFYGFVFYHDLMIYSKNKGGPAYLSSLRSKLTDKLFHDKLITFSSYLPEDTDIDLQAENIGLDKSGKLKMFDY